MIDTPPPYPSGTWHIGAVAQYSMIDVIARSQRLLRERGIFSMGSRSKWNKHRIHCEKKRWDERCEPLKGENSLELCKETIEEYTQAMRETASRVGLSCAFEYGISYRFS